jgi:hypothetical protein
MRVFILQFSNRYDVSTAKDHGQIYYLTKERLDPFDPNETVRLIRRELSQKKFDPEEDMVALTGASNLVSLFLAVLARDYDEFKVLIFDSRTEQYVLRTIDIKDSYIPF